jgi:CRISPR-associated protein Cmr1
MGAVIERRTLRVVSPLYMGSADPGKPELRAPSVKGALRFWYRALYPDDGPQAEARVFGGVKTGQGQSSFLLRVSGDQQTDRSFRGRWSPSVAYLGRGLGLSGGEKERCFIVPGGGIELTFVFRPAGADDQARLDRDKVSAALQALTLLGGLGARSRRGFGSVVAADSLPGTVDELTGQIKNLFGGLAGLGGRSAATLWHTALSRETRVLVGAPRSKWDEALGQAGQWLNDFRSYRRLKRFVTDHDIIWAAMPRDGTRPVGQVPVGPRRVAFGLPHNYFFSGRKHPQYNIAAIDAVLPPGAGNQRAVELTRRASPLFIHLHLLRSGAVVPVFTFMPATFLPAGARLRLQVGAQYRDMPKLPPKTSEGALPGNPDDPLSILEPVQGFLRYLLQNGAQEVAVR